LAKLVVSEFLQDSYVELLRSRHDVVFDPDLYGDRSRLLEEVGDAVAIFTRNRTQVDEELMAAAPGLRVVGRLGVGLDNIDMEACARLGIRVIPAVGANAVAVAEYVMGTMLILTRPVFDMTVSMVAGEWPRQGHAFGHELMGMTLGLIGLGSISREVAARAGAFGMTIVAFDPLLPESDPIWGKVGRHSLEDVLTRSDVISVHTPLMESTRNLIGKDALAMMKPSAVLINTSRGGTVDEKAVADALRSGALAGAALDVFDTEPLGPEPAATFAGLPNLLLTPHLAGNTHEAVDRVAQMVVSEVLAVIE
jgi:(S)-sulfolactate dehydrogenase